VSPHPHSENTEAVFFITASVFVITNTAANPERYGTFGRTSGNSLSSTKTSSTVKFAGIIVAKAWFVTTSDAKH
jgi:hypothetical protein